MNNKSETIIIESEELNVLEHISNFQEVLDCVKEEYRKDTTIEFKVLDGLMVVVFRYREDEEVDDD